MLTTEAHGGGSQWTNAEPAYDEAREMAQAMALSLGQPLDDDALNYSLWSAPIEEVTDVRSSPPRATSQAQENDMSEELRRVLEASRAEMSRPQAKVDEDEDLRRALEQSLQVTAWSKDDDEKAFQESWGAGDEDYDAMLSEVLQASLEETSRDMTLEEEKCMEAATQESLNNWRMMEEALPVVTGPEDAKFNREVTYFLDPPETAHAIIKTVKKKAKELLEANGGAYIWRMRVEKGIHIRLIPARALEGPTASRIEERPTNAVIQLVQKSKKDEKQQDAAELNELRFRLDVSTRLVWSILDNPRKEFRRLEQRLVHVFVDFSNVLNGALEIPGERIDFNVEGLVALVENGGSVLDKYVAGSDHRAYTPYWSR